MFIHPYANFLIRLIHQPNDGICRRLVHIIIGTVRVLFVHQQRFVAQVQFGPYYGFLFLCWFRLGLFFLAGLFGSLACAAAAAAA